MQTSDAMSTLFFFQAEDGIRDHCVTGVQTCALPICFRLAAPRPSESRTCNCTLRYDLAPPTSHGGSDCNLHGRTHRRPRRRVVETPSERTQRLAGCRLRLAPDWHHNVSSTRAADH